MKLYEILNEKYLGRKFKLIKDGIESEWIRVVATSRMGKYGYEMDHNGIWNLSEGNLLNEIELIETDEDKFEKLVKNPLKIFDYEYFEDLSMTISPGYTTLNIFKQKEDSIYISCSNKKNEIELTMTMNQFDEIVGYVDKLKVLKNK